MAAADIRSNMGANLQFIRDETGLDPFTATPAMVRPELLNRMREVTEEEQEMVDCMLEFFESRGLMYYEGEEVEEN